MACGSKSPAHSNDLPERNKKARDRYYKFAKQEREGTHKLAMGGESKPCLGRALESMRQRIKLPATSDWQLLPTTRLLSTATRSLKWPMLPVNCFACFFFFYFFFSCAAASSFAFASGVNVNPEICSFMVQSMRQENVSKRFNCCGSCCVKFVA